MALSHKPLTSYGNYMNFDFQYLKSFTHLLRATNRLLLFFPRNSLVASSPCLAAYSLSSSYSRAFEGRRTPCMATRNAVRTSRAQAACSIPISQGTDFFKLWKPRAIYAVEVTAIIAAPNFATSGRGRRRPLAPMRMAALPKRRPSVRWLKWVRPLL